MYNIGQIAKKFQTSRSTLLYYEEMGLLVPARRVDSNYRTYSEANCEKLALIKMYRRVGLSLENIKKLLESQEQDKRSQILRTQLDTLTEQISSLNTQREKLLSLLGNSEEIQELSKESWIDLLSSIGLDEKDHLKWHQRFEQKMPDAHQKFLETLKMSPEEIQKVRSLSRFKPPEP